MFIDNEPLEFSQLRRSEMWYSNRRVDISLLRSSGLW
jgi:hypothetical protein